MRQSSSANAPRARPSGVRAAPPHERLVRPVERSAALTHAARVAQREQPRHAATRRPPRAAGARARAAAGGARPSARDCAACSAYAVSSAPGLLGERRSAARARRRSACALLAVHARERRLESAGRDRRPPPRRTASRRGTRASTPDRPAAARRPVPRPRAAHRRASSRASSANASRRQRRPPPRARPGRASGGAGSSSGSACSQRNGPATQFHHGHAAHERAAAPRARARARGARAASPRTPPTPPGRCDGDDDGSPATQRVPAGGSVVEPARGGGRSRIDPPGANAGPRRAPSPRGRRRGRARSRRRAAPSVPSGIAAVPDHAAARDAGEAAHDAAAEIDHLARDARACWRRGERCVPMAVERRGVRPEPCRLRARDRRRRGRRGSAGRSD